MGRFLGAGPAIFALASCLSAATIDVTSQSLQLLQTGDSLEFLFSSHSYANYASGLGLSPYPGAIDFTFASMPLTVSGEFTAELESPDGATIVPLPNALSWQSGYAHNSGYNGPVSAVVGSLALSNALSESVFSNSEAELVLTYSGSDADVGLNGDTLRQDLSVSLLGGPMSIGGMVYSVAFDDGVSNVGGQLMRSSNALPAAAEPNSSILILAGGGLCLVAGALKRILRSRRADR
jgi:hypothetical protein